MSVPAIGPAAVVPSAAKHGTAAAPSNPASRTSRTQSHATPRILLAPFARRLPTQPRYPVRLEKQAAAASQSWRPRLADRRGELGGQTDEVRPPPGARPLPKLGPPGAPPPPPH